MNPAKEIHQHIFRATSWISSAEEGFLSFPTAIPMSGKATGAGGDGGCLYTLLGLYSLKEKLLPLLPSFPFALPLARNRKPGKSLSAAATFNLGHLSLSPFFSRICCFLEFPLALLSKLRFPLSTCRSTRCSK